MTLYEELYFDIKFSGPKTELKKLISFLRSGELEDFFEFTTDYISYDDRFDDVDAGEETYFIMSNDDYGIEIDEFDVSDPSNFMMIMRSGMRVTFGQIETLESLERKVKMLDAIIPQVRVTERSYLDLTTDKGYFGTYTEAEYEEIKKLRQEGELIKKLTEEPQEETESEENVEKPEENKAQ